MLNILTVSLLSKLFSIKSQKGVTMIEYALSAALIAVAVLVVLGTVGTNLGTVLQTIADKLSGE